MIDVIFDPAVRDSAAVTGVYQYDTGQRMRLYGLPSPQEFAGEDDLLSGNVVSMMVQFAYVGDEQTESRLASWDETQRAWIVEVPDYYLYRHEAVDVYIVIGYGYTTESAGETATTQTRNATQYRASYIPISRAAPGDTVSPEQITAWNALVTEVNLAISRTNAATTEAQEATQGALEATEAAQTATEAANDACDRAEEAIEEMTSQWGGATVSATTLEPGSDATISLTEQDGVKHFAYGIPQGKQGEKGDTGPAGVTFTLEDKTLYITIDEKEEEDDGAEQ